MSRPARINSWWQGCLLTNTAPTSGPHFFFGTIS
jgi:hypothetical protein